MNASLLLKELIFDFYLQGTENLVRFRGYNISRFSNDY